MKAKRALSFFYRWFIKIFYGVDLDKVILESEAYNDLLRHHVYSLRGIVDSVAAAVLFLGVANLVPVFKFGGEFMGSYPYVKYSMLILLVIIFIDDYMRARTFNAIIPCRSIGRFTLNLTVVILFGMAFSIFGFEKAEITELGWLFLCLAFFVRVLWALKANIESHIWQASLERQIQNDMGLYSRNAAIFYGIWQSFDKTNISENDARHLLTTLFKDSLRKTISDIFHSRNATHSKPKLSTNDKRIWIVYRTRLKRLITFSFIYTVFFGGIYLLSDWVNRFTPAGIVENIVQSDAIKITISREVQQDILIFVKIIPILLCILFYFFIEYYRFLRDIRILEATRLDNFIHVEDYGFCSKSILYLPPFMKSVGYFILRYFKFI